MDANDPRTWPDELVALRNLALAYALGRRTDPEARAAFDAWPLRRPKPQPVAVPAAGGYTTGGVGG